MVTFSHSAFHYDVAGKIAWRPLLCVFRSRVVLNGRVATHDNDHKSLKSFIFLFTDAHRSRKSGRPAHRTQPGKARLGAKVVRRRPNRDVRSLLKQARQTNGEFIKVILPPRQIPKTYKLAVVWIILLNFLLKLPPNRGGFGSLLLFSKWFTAGVILCKFVSNACRLNREQLKSLFAVP